jgi:methyl-accepting chemotaxis protein
VLATAAPQMHGAAATFALAAGSLAIAMPLAAGVWLQRGLVRGLRPATAAVSGIGSGQLDTAIDVEAGGELRPLLQGLHQVREQWFGIVSQVRTGTVNVAMNAAQVQRDNDALASRTETQAESLQETAASLEQLTAAVRHTAATAQEAHALMRAASTRAEQGGELMRGVVETMASIRASSHDIRDIIGVIDGIAFQTNILALNAAVEAARAGEQGRRFAVVAGEVRALAQRCAQAAREIKGLIGASVQQVEGGGKRVNEAGRAMAEIVESVRQAAKLMGEISAASQEQSSGIETINQAVARIDGTTQENAALVKAGERTVAALQERAGSLWTALETFRLGEREHAGAQEAVALVDSGCSFLRAHGRAALLDEINRLDFGRFIDRDLYLMALRLEDGMFLAHGNNPGRVGTGPEVRDRKGKYFTREMARLARGRGEGWVDYQWSHPVTGAVSTKSGYVRRAGDLAIYCSIQRH